ncbi:hypothetical protein GNI_016440 [Gregarina niphandrodes]|uniref:Uncharacterized protein n=1 Tax=Gregarina niphandrodes TaxID=110365 RepID=A0A023BCH6_GRENI|nr:hypothetical protein GNI_016440 [Gregarina niphandrodes]EZG82419.1 hypothetical protein GNI_016440 [Gregarina niphandrodes]|eukprot:XP_011128988.1 hypothetical protein GNI_016440 [Gregarina niphandrodes]
MTSTAKSDAKSECCRPLLASTSAVEETGDRYDTGEKSAGDSLHPIRSNNKTASCGGGSYQLVKWKYYVMMAKVGDRLSALGKKKMNQAVDRQLNHQASL